MLREVEMLGFKSFAKKSAFVFESPITAVVGPNGSGKSNVAEALRWVLGEQSLKTMRGRKGEDFIWNGSPHVPKQNRAQVTLTFDNSTRRFPGIDYEHVRVSREVERTGANVYRINGTVVRLKDVLELLSAVGLGATSHHIISQGEADRLLSARPEERRVILEDALGLRIYQYKREEAVKKMTKTEENSRQVELLRQELAPQLAFLSRQMAKAEKVEGLRREYVRLLACYLWHEHAALEAEEKAITKASEENRAQLAECQSALSLTENQQIDEKLASLEEGSRVLGARIRELRDVVARSIHELGVAQGKHSLRVEVKNSGVCIVCGQRSAKENFSDNDISRDHADTESEIVRLRAQIEAHQSELDSLETELRVNQETIRSRREEHREQDRSRYELFRLADHLSREKEALEHRQRTMLSRRDAYEAVIRNAVEIVGREAQLFHTYSLDEALEAEYPNQENRLRRLHTLGVRIEDAGAVSEVREEHRKVLERVSLLENELAQLAQTGMQMKSLADQLATEMRTQFEHGVSEVNRHYQTFFGTLFAGGTAGVKVSVPEDPNEEVGIDVDILLPHKRVRSIELLSGGERSLASLALMFSIIQVNPPPFLVLDETDAALDEANSRRYGDLLHKLSEYSQLVVITHNRETMARAGSLYGVTMGPDGVSRTLSVKLAEAI